MRNKLYHILSIGGTLILLGVASAFAQSTVALKASIPFSFKVDQTVLPAGDYTITLFRNENWGERCGSRTLTRRPGSRPSLETKHGEDFTTMPTWSSTLTEIRISFPRSGALLTMAHSCRNLVLNGRLCSLPIKDKSRRDCHPSWLR